MTFQPGTELLADLRVARDAVAECLTKLRSGILPDDAERERVDIKEEAGRRGSGGVLLPAAPQNTRAADQLADEVACMANTPGGGALIVGIEDKTGDLIGTDLDIEWLRNQIHRRVDVAPNIEATIEQGIRLLVLYVPEAREPVEDTSDRIRWRVGKACEPIDRGTWWVHRQGRAGWDAMARPSTMTVADITPGSMTVARDYIARRSDSNGDLAEAATPELLRRIGVLTPEQLLTQAGALLFCGGPRPWLSWTRLDVTGGEVLAHEEDFAGTSLLEQIQRIEDLMDAANDRVTLPGDFAEHSVRLLPPRAAREAVLNGVVHRDWHQQEPTAVTWIEADASLTVISPGGFTGGVEVTNILTQRYSRSPALADAVRALGLVDKQGFGVDRMYREMVSLGHRPPLLDEEPGPRVRAKLVGGQPVVPVMRLMNSIQPVIRRRDVQVALILHTLLHRPCATTRDIAQVLQVAPDDARQALETASRCVIDTEPIITPYKDVWTLSKRARRVVKRGTDEIASLRRSGVLWFLPPNTDNAGDVITTWLDQHDRITSGDYAALTGLTTAGARGVLDRFGDVLERGQDMGRNAHYRRRAEGGA
ncbi:DUF5635 domain-containing protein [Nocardioides plantarum]|uniref:DUF5635 domain-containing protein n=1 Tax=Nocardioides plantarum TaxID=29299 RepID=A0ABV5KGA7_9ACTN|nr:DUF5635 domain-containing protein [Nocardioides plantarum]